MWPKFQKNCVFRWHCALHWWGGHLTLWRFWLWYYFLHWNSSKNQREINRKRNYISRSCEKSKYVPSNDRHSCFIDAQHNYNIFLNPYNFWDMVPAALLSLNHTMIDTLCPISILNQQLTNLEETHIRCSLHYERWTVKGRDCASALHSFKEITYRTDEWTKQLLRLKSWVISGSREQWMELHRLWWTVIVFKCS